MELLTSLIRERPYLLCYPSSAYDMIFVRRAMALHREVLEEVIMASYLRAMDLLEMVRRLAVESKNCICLTDSSTRVAIRYW